MVRDVWFRGDSVTVESVTVSVIRVRKLLCEKILTFLISQRASGPDIREWVDFFPYKDFAPNRDEALSSLTTHAYSPHNLFPPVLTSTHSWDSDPHGRNLFILAASYYEYL